MNNPNDLILAFAKEIDVVCKKVPYSSDCYGGFVNDLLIKSGEILFTTDALPQHLLHEIAHVATFPLEFRHLLSGELDFLPFDLSQIKLKHSTWWECCRNNEIAIIGWEWCVWQELNLDCLYHAANEDVYRIYQRISLSLEQGIKPTHFKILERLGMMENNQMKKWTV